MPFDCHRLCFAFESVLAEKMKKLVNIGLVLALSILSIGLEAEEKTAKDMNSSSNSDFKFMPNVSSNPTSGTGAGVMGTLIYHADKDSSPSQAIIAAQYTTTDSYNIFVMNNTYLRNDKYHSITGGGYIFNNASLDLPVGIPSFSSDDAAMEVDIFVLFQQLYVQVYDDLYLGGQIFYIDQKVKAGNQNGEIFMREFGIEDSKRTALGAMVEYDTRSKTEKFYPKDAQHISFAFNYFPEALGSNTNFYNLNLNARNYMRGFKSDDVLAMQFYLKYCSEETPDGALATLGSSNVLRGFPLGQYKARLLTALQAEYRYQITDTKYRLTAFAGAANLSLGSKGTTTGNRDTNNGNYYSGGVGAHYILQENAGVDYRVDLAYSSDGEISVYATINQAF